MYAICSCYNTYFVVYFATMFSECVLGKDIKSPLELTLCQTLPPSYQHFLLFSNCF